MHSGLHFQTPAVPGTFPTQQLRDTVIQAAVGEALGFESVWPVEQHFDPDVSLLSAPLLLLAAIAGMATHGSIQAASAGQKRFPSVVYG